jgi:two-component system, OmpR family, response regulator CpxR
MDNRILLVEDDPDLRDILTDVLEDCGYDVIPASGEHQALEYLRATCGSDDRPALVILDVTLPMLNEWQVLGAIREDPHLQMPVIVVSSSALWRPEGAAAYLRKPFNLVDLEQTVERASHHLANKPG